MKSTKTEYIDKMSLGAFLHWTSLIEMWILFLKKCQRLSCWNKERISFLSKHNSLHCILLGDLQKLLKSSQALALNRILQSIKVILWEICKLTLGVFLPHKKSNLCPKVPSPNISSTPCFFSSNICSKVEYEISHSNLSPHKSDVKTDSQGMHVCGQSNMHIVHM